jgi:hypothetical protein
MVTPALKNASRHGVDFSLKGPPFVIGEFGFSPNYGKEDLGLPTNLKFGAHFNGGTTLNSFWRKWSDYAAICANMRAEACGDSSD